VIGVWADARTGLLFAVDVAVLLIAVTGASFRRSP
jgi:hypothetical protein